MSPGYDIECQACGFKQELFLTLSKHYERVIKILPCERCGKILWKKLPKNHLKAGDKK